MFFLRSRFNQNFIGILSTSAFIPYSIYKFSTSLYNFRKINSRFWVPDHRQSSPIYHTYRNPTIPCWQKLESRLGGAGLNLRQASLNSVFLQLVGFGCALSALFATSRLIRSTLEIHQPDEKPVLADGVFCSKKFTAIHTWECKSAQTNKNQLMKKNITEKNQCFFLSGFEWLML